MSVRYIYIYIYIYIIAFLLFAKCEAILVLGSEMRFETNLY